MPKEPSKAVAQVTQPTLAPIQQFGSYLESYKQSILPDLLKKHNIDPAQFVQIVLSEVKKNEKLLVAFQENPASMFASILAGAEIGLMPSEMLGEFYLIPRRIEGKPTVTPLIGYKGMVNIILRGGEVSRIDAECVFEGDTFEVSYGLERTIKHIPDFTVDKNAANFKFVYVVAKLKNGEYQFVVLSKTDIIKIRAMSKYENSLYFNDKSDPNFWMVKKTALIQLAKLLPKDFYGKKAVELDNNLEGGAILTLDEDNQIKLVEGKKFAPVKHPSIAQTINNLPDITTSDD